MFNETNNKIISIEVIDEKNGAVVGKRSTHSQEVAEQILADVPKWIRSYDEEIKIECKECNKLFEGDEVMKSEDEYLCRNCFDKVLGGNGEVSNLTLPIVNKSKKQIKKQTNLFTGEGW